MSSRIEYETGHQFGQLTFTGNEGHRAYKSGRQRVLEVRCSCGKLFWVRHSNLISRNTQRCLTCAAQSRRKTVKKYHGDEVNRRQCMRGYARGAKQRGFDFTLSEAEFDRLTAENCFYCGAPPSNVFNLKKSTGEAKAALPFVYNGIDRVDPTLGYSVSNCVPCCYDCNKAKNAMSPEKFRQWLTRVYQHHIKENNDGSLLSSRTILS